MSVRKLKPVTPGQRFRIVNEYSEITTSKPEKSLLTPLKRSGGRNNQGRMTMRYKGGGHKRRYRIIDYKRDKFGIKGKIATVEYDPNRSSHIALIKYSDNEYNYIICPQKLSAGDKVLSSETAEIKPGNCLKIKNIPCF